MDSLLLLIQQHDPILLTYDNCQLRLRKRKTKAIVLRAVGQYGYLDLVKRLVEKIRIDKINIILSYAAKYNQISVVKYLVAMGIDIHYRYDQALRFACSGSHMETIQYLISKRADYNLENIYDERPLVQAIRKQNIEMIEYFFDLGCKCCLKESGNIIKIISKGHNLTTLNYIVNKLSSFNLTDLYNVTFSQILIYDRCLSDASKAGNIETVKYLIENNKSQSYAFAFQMAAYNDHLDIVKYFMGNNLVNSNEIDSIIPGVIGWKHEEMWNYLKNHITDVNYKRGEMLRYACASCKIDFVLFLLEKGAISNYMFIGWTLLNLIGNKQFEIIKILKYFHNYNYQVLEFHDNELIVPIFNLDYDKVKLLSSNESLNKQYISNNFLFAVYNGDIEMIKLLHSLNNPDLFLFRDTMASCIFYTKGNPLEIIKLFIDPKITHFINYHNYTLIWMAIVFNRINIVKFLLENNLDKNCMDINLAIELSTYLDCKETTELLSQNL